MVWMKEKTMGLGREVEFYGLRLGEDQVMR